MDAAAGPAASVGLTEHVVAPGKGRTPEQEAKKIPRAHHHGDSRDLLFPGHTGGGWRAVQIFL